MRIQITLWQRFRQRYTFCEICCDCMYAYKYVYVSICICGMFVFCHDSSVIPSMLEIFTWHEFTKLIHARKLSRAASACRCLVCPCVSLWTTVCLVTESNGIYPILLWVSTSAPSPSCYSLMPVNRNPPGGNWCADCVCCLLSQTLSISLLSARK